MGRESNAKIAEKEKRHRWWVKLKADPRRYKKYMERRKVREQKYKGLGLCIHCGQPLPKKLGGKK